MNGSDLGRAVAGQIMLFIIVAAVAGAILALGGYFAIGWLVSNVSITLN